ncbi:sigma factor-like helix-turn-helix DNA-binding protein [Planococcus salinus]|uniref:RNA polymerase sigma factor 70 region 4 type 2 domain-containing protein n=1 Tax=Planococcus salinus TaxID=1848460 RepID=A0A3M8PEI3_9BACL|nr:sigma factor-like helix-turn-helix DNA-binding protein [Planococcus salinus]RNF41210.1 hypothetical protein EEX84_02360 [Planococcus salinus]
MKKNDVESGELLPDSPEKFAKDNRNELLYLMCDLEILDRDILVRRFFQGMENEEIARHMGLKEAAVAERIAYAIGLRNDWVVS